MRNLIVRKMWAWLLDKSKYPATFVYSIGISDVNLNKNQMCISSLLQDAQIIVNFIPGSTIEVGFVECGPANVYVNNKIILRMTHCQISDLVIPQLTDFYPEDEPVIVTATVSGGIEILWDNIDSV